MRLVFAQYFSFSQTFTPVSITRWKHGTCFLFLNYYYHFSCTIWIYTFIFFQVGTVTNPTIWLVLSAVRIFLSLTTVTVRLARVFFREFFFRLRAWKKINKLFTGLGLVRIVKNCDLGHDLGHSFSLYGPPNRQITYMFWTSTGTFGMYATAYTVLKYFTVVRTYRYNTL